MSSKIDLTGKKFGRLLVIKEVEKDARKGTGRYVQWVCQCDCGNTHIATSTRLIRGVCKSCGCLRNELTSKRRKKHGDSVSGGEFERLYRIWHSMIKRCSLITDKDYSNYGMRGISVCDEWRDYIIFKEWALSNGYADNLTIDRIDNDGNYCPANCRWTTYKEQRLNARPPISKTTGERTGIRQLARQYDIKYHTLLYRLKRGWTLEKALNEPVKEWRR